MLDIPCDCSSVLNSPELVCFLTYATGVVVDQQPAQQGGLKQSEAQGFTSLCDVILSISTDRLYSSNIPEDDLNHI